MDTKGTMDFLSLGPAISIALITLFLYKLWIPKTKKSNNGPPEATGAWPVIGHLHLVAGKPVHRTLAALAEKYGHVFTLRMGVDRTLVVTGWEEAKECFTTNDRAFASRPFKLAGKEMVYIDAMFAFTPYGSYWRETRKITTLKLLSATRLELLKHVRASELDTCVRDIYVAWTENGRNPVKVDMKKRLGDLMFNVIMRMIAGKRYFGENVSKADEESARQFRRAANEFLHLLMVSGLYDALPFLRWVDVMGHMRAMKKVQGKLDSILQNWVDQHRQRKFSSDSKEQDFMDVLLSTVQDGEFTVTHHDTDTVIKATLVTILAAGIDATAVALEWALALLVKNRHALEKAQVELDEHVGKDRVVDEADTMNLKYLHAIVKEALRLYPPAPLLVPHMAIEECQVGKFQIPRGTQLVVNVWKIHRDPRVWSNPEEFLPERFLTSNMDFDVKGQQFDMIPFGFGRRSCPGMGLALQLLHLTLARVLQAFELREVPNEGVDLEERFDMVLSKLNPLQVLLTPRLPLKLYE